MGCRNGLEALPDKFLHLHLRLKRLAATRATFKMLMKDRLQLPRKLAVDGSRDQF
jgi:hypothetical protein